MVWWKLAKEWQGRIRVHRTVSGSHHKSSSGISETNLSWTQLWSIYEEAVHGVPPNQHRTVWSLPTTNKMQRRLLPLVTSSTLLRAPYYNRDMELYAHTISSQTTSLNRTRNDERDIYLYIDMYLSLTSGRHSRRSGAAADLLVWTVRSWSDGSQASDWDTRKVSVCHPKHVLRETSGERAGERRPLYEVNPRLDSCLVWCQWWRSTNRDVQETSPGQLHSQCN